MARGVNKVILVGNLGKDPEVRYTASGSAVANLTVATTDSWKDKTSGEKQERTEWHKVVMFGRLGEIAGEYLKKGRQVYIEGRLQTRKWQDKEGQDRYMTEVVASDMQMLGGRAGGGGDDPGQTTADYDQMADQKLGDSSSFGPTPSKGAAAAFGADDFEDDIPF